MADRPPRRALAHRLPWLLWDDECGEGAALIGAQEERIHRWTKALETPSVSAPWAPMLFKVAATTTFLFGFAIHTTRLAIGVEQVVRYVITRAVDVVFSLVMLVAAISGLLSWRRYSGGRAGRVAYGFMMFMLLVSLPIHFRTWVTWSTDLLLAFPTWYSAIEIPMFLGLAYIAAGLKFDGDWAVEQ